tara:strand:+ start:471 stop:695 length:225 start_codon:yes stop_codon:yes gene_type:complete
MIGLLLGKFKLYAAALGAVAVAIGWAFLKGRRGAIKEAEWKRLTEYKDTRKRMDDVEIVVDADDAREWLRQRSE